LKEEASAPKAQNPDTVIETKTPIAESEEVVDNDTIKPTENSS